MFHLNERVLERLVTGASSGTEATRIGRHASTCRQCARRLEEWRDNFPEIDEIYPILLEIETGGAEVTPSGMLIGPSGRSALGLPHIDAANALWVVALLMALLVGYGAHRFRKADASLDVAGSVRRPPPASAGSGAGAVAPPTPAPTPKESAAVRATPPAEPPARRAADPPRTDPAPVKAATPAPAEPTRRAVEQPARSALTPRQEPNSSLPRSEAIASHPEARVRLPISTNFRSVSIGEASERLGGRVRMIDGLDPDHIELGPATAVPGAYQGVDVVRVVYRAPDGGRILLDQQLIPAADANDTASSAFGTAPNGVSVGTWLDADGYRLSLVARAPVDSLRRMLPLIR